MSADVMSAHSELLSLRVTRSGEPAASSLEVAAARRSMSVSLW